MSNPGSSADRAASAAVPLQLDEAEVVRRAQLGSTAAFEQLVLRRGPHLYRYLAVRLRDDGEALDALQETLAAAWQSLPALKHPAKFWPWLIGIAAHKAVDTVRKRTPAREERAEVAIQDSEAVLEIREAIASLSSDFRDVLLLRYSLDLSEEEAAEALGVRVGTVKSRTARARRALLELLR